MEDSKSIQNVLDEISLSLYSDEHINQIGVSVFTGLGGPILFFAYQYIYTLDERALQRSNVLINKAIRLISDEKQDISMEKGLCGIGWLLQHLINQNLLDSNYNNLLERIDTLALRSIEYDMKRKQYDYFTGLIGKGIYFLERNRMSDVSDKLEYIVEKLYDLAENEAYGISWQDWYSFERDNVEDKAYSLGLSHGMPSIIVFLCEAFKLGIKKELTEHLILKSVEWIKNFKREYNMGLFFPTNIVNTEIYPKKHPERLAWCHGDLGLAAALIQIGYTLSNHTIIELGKSLAKDQVHRIEINDTGVIDAELCHGSSGVALLFKKIATYMNSRDFDSAYKHWLNSTIKLANSKDGIGGYKTWKGPEKDEWVNNIGFLEGVSGIGLFLMSELYSDTRIEWSRLLLLF